MEKGVTLERALEIALTNPLPRKTELISLDQASGRILAIDLASKVDDPRFDNSAMDGWAVRQSDCQVLGNRLKIIGTSQAGSKEVTFVGEGEACCIMTGAPMPAGSDAIVMIEDSKSIGNHVIINGPARPEYIRKRAENLEKGQVALVGGSVLESAAISLSATMGHNQLEVVQKPKIAIIGVGDELIPPGEPLSDGSIYESNTYGIASLVARMGGMPMRFALIQDSIESLREVLNYASIKCDAIITSGGVSMGKWDFVREIMEKEGEIAFWRVLMRPGGPPLFGSWSGKPIFGLPGNPVSSHVVFTVLVAPWIAHSMGSVEEKGKRLANKVRVQMKEPLKGAANKLCMRRISIKQEGDALVGSTETHQGSGNIHSLVAHNGLSMLPPGTHAESGDTIDALWLL